MKSVLISIQPKWCELIASGKKTVEVRKTKPKLEPPFKCYIYCTKIKFNPHEHLRNNLHYDDSTIKVCEGQGKVIGEFMCDDIAKILNFVTHFGMEGRPERELNTIARASCLDYMDMLEYLGTDKDGYAWHISDLVIYDKPKELSEFYQEGKNGEKFYYDYCAGCPHHETPVGDDPCNGCDGNRNYFYRPPQSWCYVEEAT